MKRKLITILTLCVVLCASILGLSACNETPNAPAHSHMYNKKVTTETYLASSATCLQKAKYYFSCECGDVGSVTFEHGNYAPHVFENYTANSDAKCGVNGTETAACEQNGCSKTDTREIVGTALEHSFTNYVFDDNADCEKDGTETAICDRENCKVEHTRTKVGSALEHSWSVWSSNGNNTHTRTCLHNSAHTQTENCSGGKATCTEKAICVDCKESHGGFEKHNYIEQNTDSKYLKKEKECGAKEQYYYSCACGAAGTNYFEHGTALEHEWSVWSSNGNNTHTRTCLHNSAHTQTENCSGGTATCTEKAICVDCKESHGGFEKHNYIEQNTDSKYLKKEKECGAKAQYYYSCVCGATGTNFFEHGTALEHEWSAWSSNGNNTHTRTCLHNSAHTQTENCSGGTATCTEKAICVDCKESHGGFEKHNYVERNTDSKYLKKEKTCGAKAQYYYSCVCGATGTNFFEHGTALEHEWSAWSSNGNNTHTRTCAHDNEHIETKDCNGGTATCTELATCKDCNEKYGKLEEHTYSNEYSFSGTHHWLDATCGCDLQKDYTEHILGDDGYCSVCAAPVTDTAGIMYDTSADGTYAEVIGYEGTAKKIRIADTYNNLPVKSIYNNAFENSKITSVIIPDSVTSIGNYAFSICSSLTSVTIPDSVTSIGAFAFSHCSSLTSVTIGDSVTSIDNYAFSNCKYTVSENINYIGDENNPYAILVSVANKNFSTYTINQNTKYICGSAFYDCSRLSTITIPDSVTYIGSSAFDGCSSLTSVTIPYSVTSIDDSAFDGCSSLTSVTIPYSVTSIGSYAFRDCSSLVSVTIGNSVTSIGRWAFYNCSSLTSVTIPDSVSYIGYEAFRSCDSLEKIYCRAESQPSGWNTNWKGNFDAQVVWGYTEE